MCGPNDDMTNPANADERTYQSIDGAARLTDANLRAREPLMVSAALAEVWCAECDHPAEGPDALCGLHRRLRELRRPRLLGDFDVILIKMALQTAAVRYEEAATATPDDPYFITAHRKNMAELAAEYRRVAGLLA